METMTTMTLKQQALSVLNDYIGTCKQYNIYDDNRESCRDMKRSILEADEVIDGDVLEKGIETLKELIADIEQDTGVDRTFIVDKEAEKKDKEEKIAKAMKDGNLTVGQLKAMIDCLDDDMSIYLDDKRPLMAICQTILAGKIVVALI